MAMLRYAFPLSHAYGGFYNRQLTGLTKAGIDTKLSANQHGDLLMHNARRSSRTPPKVSLLRRRFAQLECMWQALSPLQRTLWEDYAAEQNRRDNRNLSGAARFRSMGLTIRFADFLVRKLQASYRIQLVEETPEYYTIRVLLRSRGTNWQQPIHVRPYY